MNISLKIIGCAGLTALCIVGAGMAYSQEAVNETNTSAEKIESEASAGGEQVAAVKEVTMRESFKHTLAENERLKKEKADVAAELSKTVAQANLFAERARLFKNEVDRLRSGFSAQEAKSKADAEEMRREIVEARNENNKLHSELEAMRDMRNKDKYYRLWKKSDEELKALTGKTKSFFEERDKMAVETGKLHYNLGNMCMKQGQYRKAAYEYECARPLLPNDGDVDYNLAVVYDIYLGNRTKAAYYYESYFKKTPNPKNPLLIKEKILEKKMQRKVSEKEVINDFMDLGDNLK